MKIVHSMALCAALFSMSAAVLSEDAPADNDAKTFVGKVVNIEIGRAGKNVIPVDADARFLVTIEVLKSDAERGENTARCYAIHSPTLFFGRLLDPSKVVGRLFVFKESNRGNQHSLQAIEIKDK